METRTVYPNPYGCRGIGIPDDNSPFVPLNGENSLKDCFCIREDELWQHAYCNNPRRSLDHRVICCFNDITFFRQVWQNGQMLAKAPQKRSSDDRTSNARQKSTGDFNQKISGKTEKDWCGTGKDRFKEMIENIQKKGNKI